MRTDGFPADKEAGVPCKHLNESFGCEIHQRLADKKMKGCLAYDCFGAGQKVSQICCPDINWKTSPERAKEVYDVFSVVVQLHQMQWYLLTALTLTTDEHLTSDIEELIHQNEQMTNQSSSQILALDIQPYHQRVNQILKQVCGIQAGNESTKQEKDCFAKNFRGENLDGKDFSMALMIASNLEGCSLKDTNLLGADLRDANVKNVDLSQSIFLTQMQLNTTKGNENTKIPSQLMRPISWNV